MNFLTKLTSVLTLGSCHRKILKAEMDYFPLTAWCGVGDPNNNNKTKVLNITIKRCETSVSAEFIAIINTFCFSPQTLSKKINKKYTKLVISQRNRKHKLLKTFPCWETSQSTMTGFFFFCIGVAAIEQDHIRTSALTLSHCSCYKPGLEK